MGQTGQSDPDGLEDDFTQDEIDHWLRELMDEGVPIFCEVVNGWYHWYSAVEGLNLLQVIEEWAEDGYVTE